MDIFGRLRAMAMPASVEQPPTEVYAVLVDDVYSAPLSFIIGAVTATVVGAFAAWRTGNPWLAALTLAIAAVAVVRGFLSIAYRKHKEVIRGDAAALRRWERCYAIGAAAYGACIGAPCFVAFAFVDDPPTHLLLNSSAVGFTAGATARNSSRPWIAIAQKPLSFCFPSPPVSRFASAPFTPRCRQSRFSITSRFSK